MSQPLLSVNGLMMRFGGLLAVNNVNLELYPQEIVSLIGPNGAGKTTVFNCLTGFYKPTGGTILLRDQHLEGLPGQQIARMGSVPRDQPIHQRGAVHDLHRSPARQRLDRSQGTHCGRP